MQTTPLTYAIGASTPAGQTHATRVPGAGRTLPHLINSSFCHFGVMRLQSQMTKP